MGQKLWEGNKVTDKENVFTIHCMHISNRKKNENNFEKYKAELNIDIQGVG